MPTLEHSHSAPITQPSRPLAGRDRSNTASHPRLSRVFSARHLDDTSNYQGGDLDSHYQDDDDETSDADNLEKLRQEDYDEAERHGEGEVREVRDGVLDTRDLEANLEKKTTTRSVKDPNLVRS